MKWWPVSGVEREQGYEQVRVRVAGAARPES